ncbi:MAG TPA: hypothetical protein VGA85_07640 [Dehalococcoidales bacterium]
MTLLLVLIGVLLLFIFGSLLLVMFLFSRAKPLIPEKAKGPIEDRPSPFPWKAVILPLIIFLLVLVMVVLFCSKLPQDVASRFDADGTPGVWTTKGTLIIWALLPQFLLALLAFMIAWSVTRIGALARSAEEAGIKLDSLLLVMGNMIALPQLILGFAMLNTFGYNAYQVRIVPLWAVVLIIAIAGVVILGAFFITTIRKMWLKDSS